MIDGHGRNIRYLRLSVTDLCNLRCVYCMPKGGISKMRHEDIMSIEEIDDVVSAAAECGVDKIRITGGEPLVRKGITEICGRIGKNPNVKELCITTNGVRLRELAGELKEAGVSRINLSLDTLRPERFKEITRIGRLEDVLEGINAAADAGFQGLKINVVLMGGLNDDEIPDFVGLTRDSDVQIRFIELMPIGQCSHWDKERFVSADSVLKAAPLLMPLEQSGVAELYRVPGYRGTVGLIRPISGCFCPSCDRIRVTADGRLKPCLHSAEEIMLRGLNREELKEAIAGAILAKPQRHYLGASVPSRAARDMYEIGG